MSTLTPIGEPVVFSTTSIHMKPGQMGYGRVDNPTRLSLERTLARLEGGRFALAFSSGSSAMSAVLTLLSAGDRVAVPAEMYEGTRRMLDRVFSRFGIVSETVDLMKSRSFRHTAGGVRMVVGETITNPTLQTIDVEAIARMIRPSGALLVIDNTMATPVFSKPLEMGADIVVESLTKFLNGHHDAMGGVVATNRKDIFERLREIQWTLGAVPGTQDCFLIRRGLETLAIRMAAHTQNAQAVARFLKTHPAVERVSFPGISGLVSFWLKGNGGRVAPFLKSLRTVRIAHSFGGTETTIMHPRSMMTFSFPDQKLNAQGITNGLVRLSVGLEDPERITADLGVALGGA